VANVIWVLSNLDLLDVVDILLVALVIYAALLLMRGTQAIQLLRGVILLALFVGIIGSLAGLTAFNWLIRAGGQFLAVVVAVVLQPELRRALERLGRAGGVALSGGRNLELDRVVNAMVTSCRRLSERRHGALIVLERDTGLQDYVETGVEIDSLVADELLQTIFFPSTALHDGAVIIRGSRIVAAATVLPLADTIVADSHLGTRHRAAVGITEQTDAIAVVVSEETGTISVARNGRMVRHLDERRLSTLLHAMLGSKRSSAARARRLFRRNAPNESQRDRKVA